MASVAFVKAFGGSGALKTSEYLLLAGPTGKFIMQGSMHPEQQRVVFRYLDLLGEADQRRQAQPAGRGHS